MCYLLLFVVSLNADAPFAISHGGINEMKNNRKINEMEVYERILCSLFTQCKGLW